MRFSTTAIVAGLAASCAASAIPNVEARQSPAFAGYLIPTFTDNNPSVQMHLSVGNDPSRYTFLNGGAPILKSDVGTKGVRDIFLTSDSARTKWVVIATGELVDKRRGTSMANRRRPRYQRSWLQLGPGCDDRKQKLGRLGIE